MAPLPRARQHFYGAPSTYFDVFKAAASGGFQIEGEVETLEAKLAAFVGVRHAIAVPQDRVGIYLLLKCMPGDRREVILSPYTIHDVVNMVVASGCTPVFADVEPATGNIDPVSARSLISDRTGAIMVTHLHGVACFLPSFKAMCAEHDLKLIEDSAQAFGGQYDGTRLGAYGDAGVFSFGMAKNVNSLFGGAIVTSDDAWAGSIRSAMADWPLFGADRLLRRAAYLALSDIILNPPLFPILTFPVFRHGFLHDIDAITNRLRGEDEPSLRTELPEAYRARLTGVQARVLGKQLKDVDRFSKERRSYARIYRQGLEGIEGLLHPSVLNEDGNIFLVYPIQPPDRTGLVKFMMRHGSDVTASHYHNCAEVDAFSRWKRDCPNASAAAKRMMFLPCYPGYGEQRVRYNIDLIRKFFSRDEASSTRVP